MAMNKQELLQAIADRVETMRNQDGTPNWTAIVADLNEAGITTLKDRAWSTSNVDMFYRRNKGKYQSGGSELPTIDTTELPPANQDTTTQVVTTVDNVTTDTTTEVVTPELIERLTMMLEWFEGRKPTETPERVDYRPKFIGPVRSLGLKISSPVHAAALAKAHQEPHIVGKSFNALVEYLLWEYAGKPTTLVETGKKENFAE